ncbi:MAG: cation transporting ATPase C-terminal domain-containing protein, partial [Deltaproteobacteria bacterium]|nr:cation transporting ATPase C-terminal domain-containing protein [Deltaproteobacteria bacterium]
YATIVAAQFINILSRRYDKESLFSNNFFKNKKIIWSILLSIFMCLAVFYIPGMNSFLKFAPLHISDWIYVAISAVIFLSAHEGLKLIKRQNTSS